MSSSINIQEQRIWSRSEKKIFQFFGIYFFIQLLPIDISFFRHLFSLNLLDIQYRDIFYLSRYAPIFTGLPGFMNWLIIGFIALIGTLSWDSIVKKDIHYDKLYYWLRVLVRYRLSLGILAYGFLKFFPVQLPPPSISNLNTNYGDFTSWKLFALSLGVVPDYQSFLGLVEILGGLLLLHRKTTTIGTLILLPFLGNIAISNIAYEGGEYIYAFYLIAFGLFLFSFDAIRLFRLVSLEVTTQPNHFRPVFPGVWQSTRVALKVFFIFSFIIFYGFRVRQDYKKGGYHYPVTKGLSHAEGFYQVNEFRWNDSILPYSQTDTNRWANVVFEKWNTISIASNKPIELEHLTSEEIYKQDQERIYEFAGSQGRHYYTYDLDSSASRLYLHNRNKNFSNETLSLYVDQPNDSTIILNGVNNQRDSIYAVLNKINKKYLTFEAQKTGRRGALKL